jgi:hypothetical protein
MYSACRIPALPTRSGSSLPCTPPHAAGTTQSSCGTSNSSNRSVRPISHTTTHTCMNTRTHLHTWGQTHTFKSARSHLRAVRPRPAVHGGHSGPAVWACRIRCHHRPGARGQTPPGSQHPYPPGSPFTTRTTSDQGSRGQVWRY